MNNELKNRQPELVSNRHALKPNLALLFVLASLIVLTAQPAMAAKHAAKVIYSFGEVKADGKSGARGLKKGDMVYSGETVSTVRGRAQIKFTDGGFASLQPNTDYEINEYKFEGKADGKERSFLNLLKGSVRLVTGIIGKANRKNFRIKTAVATIGIRGTQGTLSHDPNTNVTTLVGHGGEWELESGSFFGPVPQGQSYSCNGVSCATITGTRTRAEVSRGTGRKSQKPKTYQQGNQTAEDGGNCDLGGACDEPVVKINQSGAFAGTKDDGEGTMSADTNFLEGLGVVSVNQKPVAFVSDGRTDGAKVINIRATDLDAVRQVIAASLESENPSTDNSESTSGTFTENATALLAELNPELLAQLLSNPASVAAADSGTTPDGLVNFGRFVNGNMLVVTKNLSTGELDERIDVLNNHRSFHFIYGDEVNNLTFEGLGTYGLTGATFPTAADGSQIGTRPTSGELNWNFLAGSGDILLEGIVFDGLNFTLSGNINGADAGDRTNPNINSIITENGVNATYLSGGLAMMAGVTLDGNFYSENGDSAPNAAGLTYAVNYSTPFMGAAAFGLTGTAAILNKTAIMYALNTVNPGVPTAVGYSRGSTEFTMGTPLNAFTSANGDTFSQGSATTAADSGSDPATGASWARFTGSYSFMTSQTTLGSQLEDFHSIKTDYATTEAVIANTTGTRTFMLYGSTSPTIVYDNSGYNQLAGTLTQATFAVDFDNGRVDSIGYAGSFPTLSMGTFNLASAGATAFNSGPVPISGMFNDTGSAGSIGCMGGCAISGSANYGFTSAQANGPVAGVISSFNAASAVPSIFSISGVALSK